MKKQTLETVVRNLEMRVERVEQILPTLATKDDLKGLATKKDLEGLATKDALEAFATKTDLEALATKDALEALATKVALEALATKKDLAALEVRVDQLPTREEMHAAIRDEGERTRRHFDVVAEQTRADVRLVAEGHSWLAERLDALHAETKQADAELDRRVMRLEASR